MKDTLKFQSVGILKIENNLFSERSFAVKVISLLILTMYFKKYLKVFENVIIL